MNKLSRILITAGLCLGLLVSIINSRPLQVTFNVSYTAPVATSWVSFAGVQNNSDTDYVVSGYGSRCDAIYSDTYIAAYTTAYFSTPVVFSTNDVTEYLCIKPDYRGFWDVVLSNNYTTIRPQFYSNLVYVEQQYAWQREYNDYSFYSGTRFFIIIHADHYVELVYE